MHDTVRGFVQSCAEKYGPFGRVLEIGSLDVNGTIRGYFGDPIVYTGLDIAEGPGVDIVADARTWEPTQSFNCVVCTEVFEHCENWQAIIAMAAKTGANTFIATCAGPDRNPHSAYGGPWLNDEYYKNVTLEEMQVECDKYWENVEVVWDTACVSDVRVCARQLRRKLNDAQT